MSRNRLRGSLPPVLQILIVAALFGAGILLLLSSSLFGHGRSVAAEATPAPLPSGFFQPTEAQWQSLATVSVRSVPFADVTETEGSIAAADDATTQVFSPFTGRVANVFVTVGDVVSPGTPLFSGVGDEYAQAENDLATALATLRSAQMQLHVTQVNRDRLLKLLRVDGAARKDVEQSAADLATAKAAVDNAEIAAKLARAHAEVLGAAAKQSPQPGPSGAFATQVVVRAPIGGTIVQRAVGPGQFVQSASNGGANALLTISDLSHVFFAAAVTEDQIARIRVGDAVTVRMDAFPARTFDARVNFIAPAVDPNTHRIAVRARVENPDSALKPGMFGSFRIYTGAPEDHLAVPEQAVIFEGDTARVWITGPHRSIALRYIKPGKTVDGTVEVLSGLRAGDRVITGGSVFIDREAQGGD